MASYRFSNKIWSTLYLIVAKCRPTREQ